MFTKLMVKKLELVEMKTAGYWINIKMRRPSLTGYSSTRPGGSSSESFWGLVRMYPRLMTSILMRQTLPGISKSARDVSTSLSVDWSKSPVFISITPRLIKASLRVIHAKITGHWVFIKGLLISFCALIAISPQTFEPLRKPLSQL